MRPLWLLGIALILLAGCGRPTLTKSGGYVLEYRLQPNQPATPTTMAVALKQRLRRGSFPNATAVENGDLVRVELPGAKSQDLERAKKLLLAGGHLEFLICAERGKDDELIETALDDAESGQPPPANVGYLLARLETSRMQVEPWMVLLPDKRGRQQVLMVVDPDFRVTGNLIETAIASHSQESGPYLAGMFNSEGAAAMGFLSSNNLQRRMGIVLDGVLLSAPGIRAKISTHFQLNGNFTPEEVESMVTLLRAGGLPGRLESEPVKEEYVEPK